MNIIGLNEIELKKMKFSNSFSCLLLRCSFYFAVHFLVTNVCSRVPSLEQLILAEFSGELARPKSTKTAIKMFSGFRWIETPRSKFAKIRGFKVDYFILPLFLVPKLRSVAQNEWKKHPYISSRQLPQHLIHTSI